MTNESPIPTTAAEERARIEEAASDAASVAVSTVKVDLEFPAIGFIDPIMELEKMRRIAGAMPEVELKAYPEKIRAKLLAHHAAPTTAPQVTDEELALAIFIRRTTDSPLTPEDLEAKATGRAVKKDKAPKEVKKSLDDLLGGI